MPDEGNGRSSHVNDTWANRGLVMQVTIPEEVQKSPSLASPVARAMSYLQTESAKSVMQPEVHWKVARDEEGQTLLELELSEATDAVAQRFTPDQLANTTYLERRLSRLWDQLLGKKAERHLRRVSELFREMDGNGV